jgi:hypothetical protein
LPITKANSWCLISTTFDGSPEYGAPLM